MLVVKGRFTRGPPSRHHDNRPDSNLVESSRAERAGLKKLQAIPSGSCWFDDVVRASSKEHVAAADAAASACKLPRGLRSFQAVEGQSVQ